MKMTPEEIKKAINSFKPGDVVEIKFRDYEDTKFAVIGHTIEDEVIFCTSTGEYLEDLLCYSVYGQWLRGSEDPVSPRVRPDMTIDEIRKVKSNMLVYFLNDYRKNLKKRSKQPKEEIKNFFLA